MKPWRQWNVPLGLVQILVWFFLLTVVMFTWMLLATPYLLSLLATQQNFSDRHPVLYELARMSIAVAFLPLTAGFTLTYVYFYQRHYDRKVKGEKARGV